VALGCFWAEEAATRVSISADEGWEGVLPGMLACWADAAGKHEIELLRLTNLVISIRITNVICSAERAQLGTGIII